MAFFPPMLSISPHTSDVSWALLSTTASPLRVAGLYYLGDAFRVLFIQISIGKQPMGC